MRWEMGRRSTNVQDLRGAGGARTVVGGGIGTLLVALLVFLLGGDPSAILGSGPSDYSAPPSQTTGNSQEIEFVSRILGSTEDVWGQIFQANGSRYVAPELVVFSGSVESACGRAGASVGPFYCPLDQKVYIDLSFYDDLKNQLGAPGDFAQAYVLAHEVGHHVQNLLGISEQVQNLQQRVGRTQANQLSVMLELQADCFAGVWAHNAQQYYQQRYLEQGDVEEALNAAAQIGDDRLQKRSQGYVVPESFTHGTSAQRAEWLGRGLQTGDINQCNTFESSGL